MAPARPRCARDGHRCTCHDDSDEASKHGTAYDRSRSVVLEPTATDPTGVDGENSARREKGAETRSKARTNEKTMMMGRTTTPTTPIPTVSGWITTTRSIE